MSVIPEITILTPHLAEVSIFIDFVQSIKQKAKFLVTAVLLFYFFNIKQLSHTFW
jgi:hypothetical protein